MSVAEWAAKTYTVAPLFRFDWCFQSDRNVFSLSLKKRKEIIFQPPVILIVKNNVSNDIIKHNMQIKTRGSLFLNF